jgi:hypothetical protein
MQFENAQFHNIAELVEVPGRKGLRLQRVPEEVRLNLDEPARNKTLNPSCAEIRFVLVNPVNPVKRTARVILSSSEEEAEVRLFFGPFDSKQTFTVGSEPTELEIRLDEAWMERFESLPDEMAAECLFHPRVCRLLLFKGVMWYHGIRGDVRPPRPGELPETTMLSYGTSITHGAAATQSYLTYVGQTAWRLGCDLINFGVGGACLCEPAFADYMADLDTWDFASLALSVNMIGRGFTADEFRNRVLYLVGRIAKTDARRPVACISIYPYFGDWGPTQSGAKSTAAEFRRILEEVVEELSLPNLHFFPGDEILDDVTGLTVDMIHPSDLGFIRMGENLAVRLQPIVKRERRRILPSVNSKDL